MNVVSAMRVDEIGEARRAADPGEGDDFFLRIVQLFENFIKRSEDGEITASGAPRRMVRGENFLGERRARSVDDGRRKDGGGHGAEGKELAEDVLGLAADRDGGGEQALFTHPEGGVGETKVFGHSFDDLTDFICEAIGLGDAGDCGVAITGAQQRGELTIPVESLVVDFDHQDFLVTGKNFFQAVVQWMDMADLEMAGGSTRTAQAADGFPDWAVGTTPADEQHIAGLIAE